MPTWGSLGAESTLCQDTVPLGQEETRIPSAGLEKRELLRTRTRCDATPSSLRGAVSPFFHRRDLHRSDSEQHDCEIAQEIQEKLTIEAERRRIQEKKDEDIARLLQEKELQEEKRRKKHTPEFSGGSVFGDNYYHEDGGMKPRGIKEAVSTPARASHRDQEWYDAEIARKLQEEELLATHVDMRAAQVAQDEEIARLLMAEEKKAYKKAKEREKSSLDKRKHDPECKLKAKSAHSKSKEGDEAHRSKIDRPSRPPPPTMMGLEDTDPTHFTNQHSTTWHLPKSESSQKGFHNKQ